MQISEECSETDCDLCLDVNPDQPQPSAKASNGVAQAPVVVASRARATSVTATSSRKHSTRSFAYTSSVAPRRVPEALSTLRTTPNFS